jgi:hypothetical protein
VGPILDSSTQSDPPLSPDAALRLIRRRHRKTSEGRRILGLFSRDGPYAITVFATYYGMALVAAGSGIRKPPVTSLTRLSQQAGPWVGLAAALVVATFLTFSTSPVGLSDADRTLLLASPLGPGRALRGRLLRRTCFWAGLGGTAGALVGPFVAFGLGSDVAGTIALSTLVCATALVGAFCVAIWIGSFDR